MSGRGFRPGGLRFRGRAASRHRRAPFLLSAVLGIGLALVVIRAIDASVRPVLTDMAVAKTRNQVTGIVNQAVEDAISQGGLDYEDVVRIQTGSNGRITAMTTDTAALNRLRAGILDTVVAQVDDLDAKSLGIPLGNLTGLSSASDWGPSVPVKVAAVASAGADFEHIFTAAGINQTFHQIMLNVSVTVQLLIPGGTIETVVDTQVCVAETVVVGEVPGTYLELP